MSSFLTPLTISERRAGRRAVLSVAGEVDLSTADDLRSAIETAGAGASEIWLDLTETTFMDSSGVHALAKSHARLAEANHRFVVVCPEGPVLRVLTLTGFDRILEIHPTRELEHYAITA